MSKATTTFVLASMAAFFVGCSSESTTSTEFPENGTLADNTETIKLTGSGASFPYPLYDRWFKDYSANTDGVRIDYQAKGSGAGIKDFINGTTDFGASDAAMNDEEIAQVDKGVQLLPMTAGEVVLAYNLAGVNELKLSREAYVGILLGKITNWQDPAIVKTNADIDLPDLDITVARRADSSGTTFVFTQHLSAISEDWKNGPGTGKTVVWPNSDKFIAAPKNDGVTATIKQTPGAIGYIEYGYAKLTKIPMVSLENRSGKFVQPSLASGQAALANVEMPVNLRAWLPDPEGEDAYPIVSYTWLLCYKNYDDPKKAEALKGAIRYCLTEGQKISDEMGYVPLPQTVVEKVTAALENIR
ncbi:phosphate ABC transporter substrate-binding protein PstS [Aporhodopirellula aestuarii]|uniref:Phosphate-binding protein n=1 Tax=Aporhodopirellula aestuarii TaxID=2950107 RepID=A0ABT0UBE6_9BACT|nr:phosphate ABC transporter substrate-binding protein PstS [Aporhodopirellula aestuarii]MCM2374235.1 phosphate ABC transporter substrate-binding protein PstS [Aporhodopirellula aestuarii]